MLEHSVTIKTIMKTSLTILILLVSCAAIGEHFVEGVKTFNVINYGAQGDGAHLNTNAIGRAIAAAAAISGGGIVHFPRGHYLTGPIHLKSHVHLHLDDGVLIKFSDHFDHYLPMVQVRWEGTLLVNFSPLIYGNNVTDVGVIGSGNATLDGSGKKWWDFFKHLKAEHKKTGHYNTSSKWQVEFHKVNHELMKHAAELLDDHGQLSQGFLRPQFFQTIHSREVRVEGVTFIDSPFWTVTPAFSDNISIDRVTIRNPAHSPNTDGIDPDSCRNVTISGCHIDVGDDCVCIKSGKDKQARQLNRPSENITVKDCIMMHGHGGLVIGSEMSGSVRHIRAYNLTFHGTDRGIRIKSTRGRGGVVEDVHINDVRMSNITHEGITINTYYTKTEPEPVSERTPYFHKITIEGVSGDAKMGIQIMGLPERHLEDITLTNISLVAKKEAIVVTDADHVRQVNVTVTLSGHHHHGHV